MAKKKEKYKLTKELLMIALDLYEGSVGKIALECDFKRHDVYKAIKKYKLEDYLKDVIQMAVLDTRGLLAHRATKNKDFKSVAYFLDNYDEDNANYIRKTKGRNTKKEHKTDGLVERLREAEMLDRLTDKEIEEGANNTELSIKNE